MPTHTNKENKLTKPPEKMEGFASLAVALLSSARRWFVTVTVTVTVTHLVLCVEARARPHRERAPAAVPPLVGPHLPLAIT
jgi:hypothetical protein